MWNAILLSNPNTKPLVLEDFQVEGDQPKPWLSWTYGDNQENEMLFRRIGMDPDTRTVYFLKWRQKEGDRVVLELVAEVAK